MKSQTGKFLVVFSAISLIAGGVQIILGQSEYNSILIGIQNSYVYFALGFIILGIAKIIDLLEDMKTKLDQ